MVREYRDDTFSAVFKTSKFVVKNGLGLFWCGPVRIIKVNTLSG